DSPKSLSRVRMTRNPAEKAASASAPLPSSRQPRPAVVSQSTPSRFSTGMRPLGRLTSSSHIGLVRYLRSKPQDLGDTFLRKLRVVSHNLLVGHSFGKASENKRNGKTRSSDNRFTAEFIRVARDPAVTRKSNVFAIGHPNKHSALSAQWRWRR